MILRIPSHFLIFSNTQKPFSELPLGQKAKKLAENPIAEIPRQRPFSRHIVEFTELPVTTEVTVVVAAYRSVLCHLTIGRVAIDVAATMPKAIVHIHRCILVAEAMRSPVFETA